MFKEKTLERQKKEYLDLMNRLSTLTRELKGTRLYLTFFKEATSNGTYIKTGDEWKKIRNFRGAGFNGAVTQPKPLKNDHFLTPSIRHSQ